MAPSAPDPSRLLRRALRANAVFSLLSGGFMLVADGLTGVIIGQFTALGPIHFVGANLVVFAIALLWLASRDPIPPALAMAVVVADALWVLGSWIAMASGVLPDTGWWAVGTLADIVLLFAIVQFVGVRRLPGAATQPA